MNELKISYYFYIDDERLKDCDIVDSDYGMFLRTTKPITDLIEENKALHKRCTDLEVTGDGLYYDVVGETLDHCPTDSMISWMYLKGLK